MSYYLVDENNNRIEGLSKEEIYGLLAKAIKDKTLPDYDTDEAFITKLKDPVSGETHNVAFVTTAKYNELQASGSLISNCLYFLTDETTADDIEKAIELAKEEAIEEAKENTAEGLAKKLDLGDWAEYSLTSSSDYSANTDISCDVTLSGGQYIGEIISTNSANATQVISLGVFTLGSTTYLGKLYWFGSSEAKIYATITATKATIRGTASALMSGGNAYTTKIRFMKIA